jgi:hypothetical protein
VENCVTLNLIIPNQGNKPSSVICKKKEVTDLILESNKIGNSANDWHAHTTSNLCQITGTYALK